MTNTIEQPPERDRIIEVAARLFYEQGVQAVGMDAIRTAAGVSLKRLYREFAAKDDLVVAALEYRTGIWDRGVAAATGASGTPRERLLAVYDFLDVWFRAADFRGCGFINAFGEMGALSPRVAATARRQKEHFQRYVHELVEELGGPPALADQLALLAEGAQTTAAISGGPEPAAVARAAAETLIDAAAPPAG